MGAARSFVEQYRQLLRVPDAASFTVGPRLKVTKKYYHRAEGEATYSEAMVTECLVKAWWCGPTGNTAGTTAAIDWETGKLRVLLTSDRSDRPEEARALEVDRARFAARPLKIACCKV